MLLSFGCLRVGAYGGVLGLIGCLWLWVALVCSSLRLWWFGLPVRGFVLLFVGCWCEVGCVLCDCCLLWVLLVSWLAWCW